MDTRRQTRKLTDTTDHTIPHIGYTSLCHLHEGLLRAGSTVMLVTNAVCCCWQSFMVVDAILERNPEVSFKSPIDMDRVSHCCLVHIIPKSRVVSDSTDAYISRSRLFCYNSVLNACLYFYFISHHWFIFFIHFCCLLFPCLTGKFQFQF